VCSYLPIHNLELICVEVQSLRSKPFNIISWYRPPNAHIDSSQQPERVLAFIDREVKETIRLRDTNCDFIERPAPLRYVKILEIYTNYSDILK